MRIDLLEYPEIVKSKLKIYNFEGRRSIEGRQPIEKPDAMGLDKVIEAAFKDYERRFDVYEDQMGILMNIAQKALLGFENDPRIIQDRQRTMQYFFENDALRKFINTQELPKDSFFLGNGILRNPLKVFFILFKNKEIFVDYIEKLEKVLIDPPSEVMKNVKTFLQEVIKEKLPALKDQIAEVTDCSINLNIANKLFNPSIKLTAVNSNGESFNLQKILSENDKYNKLIEPYITGLLEYANEKEGKNFDNIEVTITKGSNVKIEILTNQKFRKQKRKEILIGEYPIKEKLLEQFVGNLTQELERIKKEEESTLYSTLTRRFLFFWQDLKYYSHMADYFHSLEKQGFPLFMPDIAPEEECVIKVDEGYSFNLIRNMPKEQIIPNDINIGENGTHIYLITGPNKNGKTTFMNMTAGFLAAFQAGWYIPCKYARISPKKGIKSFYTEIASEDDAESKFSKDGIREKQIFQRMEDYDMVPMDEPMTSTNSDFIKDYLQKVVRDVLPHSPKVLFMITSHEHSLIDIVEELPKAKNLKCDVTEQDNGKIIRTYKIIPGYSTISNAEDLMKEIGADPESLIGYMKESAEQGKLTFV